MAVDGGVKSKTLATWIALVGGCLGLHRFYLHGFGDRWGWLYPLPSLAGWIGVQRMQSLGQDDRLAWVLIPFLGLMIAVAAFTAILHGLTPDEKWNARHNAGRAAPPASGWAAVIGVVLSLVIGGSALMATIAFSAQRYFENEALLEQERLSR